MISWTEDPALVVRNLDSITIDVEVTYQSIASFGSYKSIFREASNFLSAKDVQKVFGTGDEELGLTIFRVSIPPNSNRWSNLAVLFPFDQDLAN